MNELRIILDKSVTYGLNNTEIESLDRYYFLIVPPILTDEILADLTREAEDQSAINRISAQSYRISGNRGLTPDYRLAFGASLEGWEIEMEGKFLPLGEQMVQAPTGSFGMVVDNILEDETIARWERQEFTDEERSLAAKWRQEKTGSPSPEIYFDAIAKAGLSFSNPTTLSDMVKEIDRLLDEPSLQLWLFDILLKEHPTSMAQGMQMLNRWIDADRPKLKDFAPYAYFCLRVDFIWTLSITLPEFTADKNDRKDREYCYYLPFCEIFASKDLKHELLVPYFLQPFQRFVRAEDLKRDLAEQSLYWASMSRESQIENRKIRGSAPPEIGGSLTYETWKQLRGKLSPSLLSKFEGVTFVDSSLPPEQQKRMTLEEILRSKLDVFKKAKVLSNEDLDELRTVHPTDPSSFRMLTTRMSRERLKKLYPELTDDDLDRAMRDE